MKVGRLHFHKEYVEFISFDAFSWMIVYIALLISGLDGVELSGEVEFQCLSPRKSHNVSS